MILCFAAHRRQSVSQLVGWLMLKSKKNKRNEQRTTQLSERARKANDVVPVFNSYWYTADYVSPEKPERKSQTEWQTTDQPNKRRTRATAWRLKPKLPRGRLTDWLAGFFAALYGDCYALRMKMVSVNDGRWWWWRWWWR